MAERSIMSPDFAMIFVSSVISWSFMPLNQMAMSIEDI